MLSVLYRCESNKLSNHSSYTDTSDSTETAVEIEGCKTFPLHPPKASAFKIIPKNLLRADSGITDLNYVINKKILPALDSAGYEYSFYCIKDSGIAIVTRLEKINEDGTSDLTARYLSEYKYRKLSDYLLSLIRAKPGFYRVIVFVISPYAITQSKQALSKQGSDSLYSEGSDRPYQEILSFPFSDKYQCTSLIYEFKKPNEEEDAKEILPSSITCMEHLTRAKIWSHLQNE